MSFDPRIVREPDDGDDIPTEMLDELGAQLTADAQHLAALYPPRKRPRETKPSWLSWQSRWTAAAVALFVLTSVSLPVAWLAMRPILPAESPTAITVAESPTPIPEAKLSPSKTTESADSFVSSFENLTGPEWEGVLDLLEQESQSTASLSL